MMIDAADDDTSRPAGENADPKTRSKKKKKS